MFYFLACSRPFPKDTMQEWLEHFNILHMHLFKLKHFFIDNDFCYQIFLFGSIVTTALHGISLQTNKKYEKCIVE